MFDLILAQLRIAIWIQQALFGRQHTSSPVDFNRTAFHHYPRLKSRQLQQILQMGRDRIVLFQFLVFVAPGVENPIVIGNRMSGKLEFVVFGKSLPYGVDDNVIFAEA